MSQKDKEVSIATPMEIAPNDLSSVMKIETERRALIKDYIAHHMVKDVDYGEIMIGGRKSKPSLFKPGSEKFLSLFKLTATFEKDGETWEMAGSVAGLFTYVCKIRTNQGNVVGEGRGAANLVEKQNWTVNNAVKIAQKRAQIDAVLRMGALSDFFTQDLEDMVPEAKYDTSPIPTKAKPVIHGADDPTGAMTPLPIPPTNGKPWRNPKAATLLNKTEQKQRIVALVNDVALNPVETKKEYEDYVRDNTGLNLVEANFPEIIKRLEKVKGAKEEIDGHDNELESHLKGDE